MTARGPWFDARQYLAERAAEVEALWVGMPPERVAEYRASSKPHTALQQWDALVAALRDLVALTEDQALDASVGDDKFPVIVRAREVLRTATTSAEAP